MSEFGISVGRSPSSEATFYIENDGTIWAIYNGGLAQFLSENNKGDWHWYFGNLHYANTMDAELLYDFRSNK